MIRHTGSSRPLSTGWGVLQRQGRECTMKYISSRPLSTGWGVLPMLLKTAIHQSYINFFLPKILPELFLLVEALADFLPEFFKYQSFTLL